MCTPSLAVDGGSFLACFAVTSSSLELTIIISATIPAIIEFFDKDNTPSLSGIVIGTKRTKNDLASKLALVGGFVEVGEKAGGSYSGG